MNLLSRRRLVILCALLTASMTVGVFQAAGQSFNSKPASTLVLNQTVDLPIAPTGVVVQDQSTYVIGDADGVYQILQLDSDTMEIVGTRNLQFTPNDFILSYDGKEIYIIGKRDDYSELVILGSSLELIGHTSLSRPIAYPKLSLTKKDALVIAGMATRKNEGGVIIVNVAEPSLPFEVEGTFPEALSTLPVTGAWLGNSEEPVLYLSAGTFPALVAYFGNLKRGFGTRSFTEEASSYLTDADTKQPISLKVRAMMKQGICRKKVKQDSFLVASPGTNSLYLLLFDKKFRSLDVVARTPTSSLTFSGVDQEKYINSEIPVPSILLDSSCDFGVIWLGNRYSSVIKQFTFNREIQSFEKIGEIRLPVPASALVIDKTGKAAVAISTSAKTISRFHSGSGEVLGTEARRKLQRLLVERGYLIGAIDGLIGEKTIGALKLLENNNKIALDINRDLEGAIKAIEGIPTE